MSAGELVDILRDQHNAKDEAQSGVVCDKVQPHASTLQHLAPAWLLASSLLLLLCCQWLGQLPCTAQVLEQLLDREHLEEHTPAPHARSGVGYEVIQAEVSGLLSGVE